MRKPSDADLRTALTVGHFGTDAGPLPPGDPLSTAPMVLAIDQIDAYDRNPRKAPNGKYEELKESIRLNGLRQPLVITRRPGAARYIPKHGGNTRLVILKDLLAETAERRFATANCLFEPWTTEADVLVGHLVENEMRGELVFIDKARAIADAKGLIEQESGTTLTMRQLADELRGRGYRVSLSIIPSCEYAVDVLAGSIPRALAAGLGRPGIQRIRDLDRAAQIVWGHRNLGPDELYRSIFAEAVASVDHEIWDFDRARRALAEGVATRAGTESRHVLLEIGAELAGAVTEDDDAGDGSGPPLPVEDFTLAEPWPAPGSDPTAQFDTRELPAESPSVNPAPMPAPRTAQPPAAVPERNSPSLRSGGRSPTAPDSQPAGSSPAAGSPLGPQRGQTEREAERLRQALRDSARDYATHAELGYCLRFGGSPWIRLGYIVADFPAPAHLAQLGHDFRARESLAWKWYELTRCCDLLPIAGHIERLYGQDPAAKERVFAELFGPNPRYLQAWASPDTFLEALSESVGIMDLQQFSFYAEGVDDDTWQAGMRLLQAYRDLKSFAVGARIDLMQDNPASDSPPATAA